MKFYQLAELWFFNKEREGLCYTYQREIHNSINHLNRFIGEKELDEIKPLDIDNIIVSLAKFNPNTGRPMSKKGIKDIINTANSIFEFAVDNDYLVKNPARNRKVPRNAKQSSRRALTNEEQALIMATPHTRCKCGSLLMLFCGLRTGEMLALKWSCVDLKRKLIYVNQRVQRTDTNEYTITDGTKNGKHRQVPIPDSLIPFLERERASATSIYLCSKSDGSLHSPSSWKSLWNSYYAALNMTALGNSYSKYNPNGVPVIIDHITPHMLRHTYATLLYKSGVDVLSASEFMGHSNIQITLDIYTHLDKEHTDKNIGCLNDYINKLFQEDTDSKTNDKKKPKADTDETDTDCPVL